MRSLILLLVALAIGAGSGSSGYSERQGQDRLKPGKGREIVATVCTSCHTADIIVASHMSRKSWDTTLTWMEETQGLAPLDPELRETILDYLEETQGLNGDAADSASSPWAYPLYRANPIW